MNDDKLVVKEPAGDSFPRVGFGLFCTVMLVVLADWLFFDHPQGWTAGAFGLLLIGALSIRAKWISSRKPARLVMWLTAVLFLGCVEEPNVLLLWLGVLGLVTLSLTLREGWVGNAVVWMKRWVSYAFKGWLCLPFGVNALRSGCRDHREREKGPSFSRRWLVAIGLSGLFLMLFTFANPVIEKWLGSLADPLLNLFDRLPDFRHIVFWVVAGVQIFALLCYRTGITKTKLDFIEDEMAGAPGGFFSPAAVLRSLLAFNLLFGIQTVLDLFYLWGGAVLPDGMTYAQYAHRGAYPLIVTAVLAAGFVLLTFQPGQSPETVRWSRRLVYLWLLQNVFLVISAGWRLWLYVDAYSLTRLRMAAAIWMVLIACGLLYIIIRIATGRSNLWLINANTITVVAILFLCSFVNMDGVIAAFNVRHCEEILGEGHQPIDGDYLAELGYDTLPALFWLMDKRPDFGQSEGAFQRVQELTSHLNEDMSDWRGWTFRRARIRDTLQNAGADFCTEPDAGKFTFGKVVSVSDGTLVIREYDFATDAAVEIGYATTDQTELGNINQIADLKDGDDIVVDYTETAGNRIITTLVKEKKNEEVAADTSEPVLQVPVTSPRFLRSTGIVVSLTPGNLRIKEMTGAETGCPIDYSISRNVELQGLDDLSDLKLNEKITVDYVKIEGRRYIRALMRRTGDAGVRSAE